MLELVHFCNLILQRTQTKHSNIKQSKYITRRTHWYYTYTFTICVYVYLYKQNNNNNKHLRCKHNQWTYKYNNRYVMSCKIKSELLITSKYYKKRSYVLLRKNILSI